VDFDATGQLLIINSAFVKYGVAQKERMFINLHAISFFGVTSNQKSTFENLGQSTI